MTRTWRRGVGGVLPRSPPKFGARSPSPSQDGRGRGMGKVRGGPLWAPFARRPLRHTRAIFGPLPSLGGPTGAMSRTLPLWEGTTPPSGQPIQRLPWGWNSASSPQTEQVCSNGPQKRPKSLPSRLGAHTGTSATSSPWGGRPMGSLGSRGVGGKGRGSCDWRSLGRQSFPFAACLESGKCQPSAPMTCQSKPFFSAVSRRGPKGIGYNPPLLSRGGPSGSPVGDVGGKGGVSMHAFLGRDSSMPQLPSCLPPRPCPSTGGMRGVVGEPSSFPASGCDGSSSPFSVVGRAWGKQKPMLPQALPSFSSRSGVCLSPPQKGLSSRLSPVKFPPSTPLNFSYSRKSLAWGVGGGVHQRQREVQGEGCPQGESPCYTQVGSGTHYIHIFLTLLSQCRSRHHCLCRRYPSPVVQKAASPHTFLMFGQAKQRAQKDCQAYRVSHPPPHGVCCGRECLWSRRGLLSWRRSF